MGFFGSHWSGAFPGHSLHLARHPSSLWHISTPWPRPRSFNGAKRGSKPSKTATKRPKDMGFGPSGGSHGTIGINAFFGPTFHALRVPSRLNVEGSGTRRPSKRHKEAPKTVCKRIHRHPQWSRCTFENRTTDAGPTLDPFLVVLDTCSPKHPKTRLNGHPVGRDHAWRCVSASLRGAN